MKKNLSKSIQKAILIGLILLVFFVPITPNINITNYKLFIAQILIIVLFLLWMFRVLILNESVVKTPLNFPLLTYILLTIISYFYSEIKSASFEQLFENFLLVSLVFIGINNITSPKQLNYILNSWIISATLVASYGILQVFGLDLLRQGKGIPCFSTYGNPNLLSSFLIISLSITFGKFIASRNFLKKTILIIFTLIIFLTIILTLSRAGIVSLLSAGAFFFFLFYIKNKERIIVSMKKLSILIIIFILLFTVIIFSIYTSGVKEKMDNLLSKELPRVYIWKATFELIRQKPLFGYGVGTFPIYFSQKKPPELLNYFSPAEQFINHAHNEFLEITQEMGIIGLGVFLWIVILALKLALNLLKPLEGKYWQPVNIALIASIISSLIFSLVTVNLRFIGVNLFFFLCIGIIGIIYRWGQMKGY